MTHAKLVTLALATFSLVGLAATQQTKTPPTAPVAKAAAPAAAAEARNFTIDDVHSATFFRVQHSGAGQFWGRISGVTGTMAFDSGNAPTSLNITVATDSIDSSNAKLDSHLKSPDFFNVQEFPTMTFVSTAVKPGANGMFDVSGDFTMHGVTKSITATIEVTGITAKRGGAEATFSVKRSEYGMTYGVDQGSLGDVVKVIVNLEGTDAK